LIQPDLAQPSDNLVRRALRHIEVQRIPVGIPDRPAEHDQVHDRRFCV